MKKALLSILLLVIGCQMAAANPLPPYYLDRVRAFPPQIWLTHIGPVDLSGVGIGTTSGTAIIDSGVYANGYEPILLDSSNTSGFVLNPEGDFVDINLQYFEQTSWGTRGVNSSPIKGYSIVWGSCGVMFECLTFDFASGRFGYTPVIINEINSHCDWNNGCNFIELYNKSNSTISLAGWKIVCDTILSLPDNARIGPHGFYVVDEVVFPPSFDMDFASDNVYLIDSDNNLVDQVGWSSDHGADVSFMRFPDGDADSSAAYGNGQFMGYNDATSVTFENGFPTRGAANRYESPGLKIIGIRCDTSYRTVDISWTNPVWLTVFEQAIVRRSTDSLPQTPYDGEIMYEGNGQFYSDRDIWPGHTYYYTIFARTGCGDYSTPDSESQFIVTFPEVGVDEDLIPENATLLECYPNPFNASTLIRYRITEPGPARLAIYNLAGQRVALLCEGIQKACEYSIVWDGSGFASGIYFARLESGPMNRSVKLALLK